MSPSHDEDERQPFDEQRLAELLAALPPAPDAWVQSAKELPRTRRELEEIARLAEEDAAFRAALERDVEAALRDARYEPRRSLVAEVRRRLGD